MFHKLVPSRRKPSTSFQVVSDLHLEVNHQYASFSLPADAPRLILAGDIGRLIDYDEYREFIRKQTEQFEQVLLILGNHEFYQLTFAEGVERARRLERDPCLNGRLVFLHRQRYDIPDSNVSVLGCTLWSHVPDEARERVTSVVQDYKRIQDWSVDAHNAVHADDVSWLLDEVQTIREENAKAATETEKRSGLVVTHHAPLLKGTSNPQYEREDNLLRFAFATDVLSQVSPDVKVWVFGHTHYSTDFKVKGIRVVSNQRGYVLSGSEKAKEEKNGFDAGKVVFLS